MANQVNGFDDEMPAEIDFSEGSRSHFFVAETRSNLPVFLDADILAYLSARAEARGIDVVQLVNELLRKDIELIETVK